MSHDIHEPHGDETLLRRWLDGELEPAEAAAFEARLGRDPALQAEVAALRRMEAWLRDTRPAAPAPLAASVMAAIAAAGSARDSSHRRGRLTWLPVPRAWAWVPVAAAAALVVGLVSRSGRTPPPVVDVPPAHTATAPADSVRYLFQLDAGQAHEVCLVGSFNLWRVCDIPLQPTRDGGWAVTVQLPRGRHEYVFVVDGRWIADPAAPLRVDDDFGGQKAVLLL